MNITVLYFASLADSAHKSQEIVAVEADTSIKQLYAKLKNEYGFKTDTDRLRVAINDEFADWQDALKEGDTLAFIPPVAGG